MTDMQMRPRHTGGMVIGIIIMLLGVTLLLDRAGLIEGFDGTPFWPLVLVAIGISLVWKETRSRARVE